MPEDDFDIYGEDDGYNASQIGQVRPFDVFDIRRQVMPLNLLIRIHRNP
jgi:hypothetical protein